MVVNRIHTGLFLLLAVLQIGGCSANNNRELVCFVPVIREEDGTLKESSKLMKDKDFRIGLAIVLTEYEHEFKSFGKIIKVRRMMELEHINIENASCHDSALGKYSEDRDMDYRANMTLKALIAYSMYKDSLDEEANGN